MALVFIPIPLRPFTRGAERLTVPGASLRQVIDHLETDYPGLKACLVEDGEMHPAISVAVDGEVVQRSLLVPVGERSEVHFLPAISGG